MITGASRGLGLGYARTLLDRDSTIRVIATARNPDTAEHLHALKEKLGQHARRLHVVKMDVVSAESCLVSNHKSVGELERTGTIRQST